MPKKTERNTIRGKALSESYNRARTKKTKTVRYAALMEFEEEMLRLGQSG